MSGRTPWPIRVAPTEPPSQFRAWQVLLTMSWDAKWHKRRGPNMRWKIGPEDIDVARPHHRMRTNSIYEASQCPALGDMADNTSIAHDPVSMIDC